MAETSLDLKGRKVAEIEPLSLAGYADYKAPPSVGWSPSD